MGHFTKNIKIKIKYLLAEPVIIYMKHIYWCGIIKECWMLGRRLELTYS